MAKSQFMGRKSPTEPAMNAYVPAQQLIDRFEAAFGSTNCRVLTGCDLNTPEGQDYFKTNNIRAKCQKYSEEATKIAMSRIETDRNAY